MISKIDICNFKSIDQLTIKCKKINLFVGINSSGKSTILQALLFIMQNMERLQGFNGDLVSIGTFNDCKCRYSAEKQIRIALYDDNEHTLSSVLERMDNGTESKLHLFTDSCIDQNEVEYWRDKLNYAKRKTQYLSCRRIGAQKTYAKNMTLDDIIDDDGKYAISFLNAHGTDLLEAALCKGEADYTLLGQVNWWLNYITGAEISTEELPDVDMIKASYRMEDISGIRPDNIGAGISYLVSILIMCLSMPAQGIAIIENPEIHLHPLAQARVCEFFAFIAESNRQLFIESHSDHIFNGFRAGFVAGSISKEAVDIEFLYLNERHVTEAISVEFGKYGKILNQRENLFDQFDIDMSRMITQQIKGYGDHTE